MAQKIENLQDVLDSCLREQFSSEVILPEIIRRRVKKLGIELTQDQLAEITSKIKTFNSDELTFQIPDEQVPSNLFTGKEEKLELNLTDIDDDDLKDIQLECTRKWDEFLPEIITDISQTVLKDFEGKFSKMLKKMRKKRRSFEKNIYKEWGNALDLLEMLMVIALEAGDSFNNEFRNKASEEYYYTFEVLTRLHARACQVASEILVLLKSGHADGAHARWRCLHEIAVVCFFILSAGNTVAEAYILHEEIESFKAAKQYQYFCNILGHKPISEKELDEIINKKNQLIMRYGKDFIEDYGWASGVLNKKRPTFRDIEEHVGLDYLRPYYKLSSHNIHANPKGIFFKLGLKQKGTDILLAGPSILGLADPGHGTALSLVQITVTLLNLVPNLDRLIICDILQRLKEKIGQAFLKAHKSIEEGANMNLI